MRKLIELLIISFLVNSIQPAEAAKTIQVKNCVNIKTGNARVVPSETIKCKKGEKLFKFSIPATEVIKPADGKDGSTILSGTTDPKPELGKIGDYNLDTKFRWLYGPKTLDGWGQGISMIGSSGGGGGTGPKGDKGDTGAAGADGFIPKYGWFYDTQDRQATAINTTNPIYINTVGDNSHGVTVESNTQVSVAATGTYNIAFSSQIFNSDTGAAATISIWLQKKLHSSATWNDVPWSNSDVDIPRKDATGKEIIAWNFFLYLQSDEDFRIVWQTTNINAIINSVPAASPKPAIPGTILTVNQVG